MRYLGKISDDKDLVTKEYVDESIPTLTDSTFTTSSTIAASATAVESAYQHGAWFGTCTTVPTSSAKVVTCNNFTLTQGARIAVKFTGRNASGSQLTLNVNNTGSITVLNLDTNPIQWSAGQVIPFVFNGTQWQIEGVSEDAYASSSTNGNHGFMSISDKYKLNRIAANATANSITMNGSTNANPSFYAPTTAGTAGYVLASNGSGAPSWESVVKIAVSDTEPSRLKARDLWYDVIE